MAEYKLLTKDFGAEALQTLKGYEKTGGYQGLRDALSKFTPDALVNEVKTSGIRGRGGAGFPTGMKWSFLPKDVFPRYLCVNADESEPGCFKDRYLIDESPHQLVEGVVIAAYALQVNIAFIYIRGEYRDQRLLLERAVEEARAAGYIGRNIRGSGFDCDVIVHGGAGAYICGEETALIESLEGKRGFPRLKPPFPAVVGVFGKPTVVNNVETLACVPHIMTRGAHWFSSIGRPRNTGPKLYCVSGQVKRPGVYELPLGVTFRELIFEHAGGMRGDRGLKAFFPGGTSAPVMTAAEVDVKADFDACAEAHTMLGSAAIIVLDESVDIVEATANVAHFYAHESCGQCTPCREGADWCMDILDRMAAGHGRAGDPDTLLRICRFASEGMTICPLGDAFALPISSMVRKFRAEFERHIASATPLPQRVRPVLPWAGPRPGFGT